MNFRCPVCLFAGLPYPPADYNICPCCGTEFGSDDNEYTHEQLLARWIAGGALWFYGHPPTGWNPWLQLAEGGRMDLVLRVQQGASEMSVWAGVKIPQGNVRSESNVLENPLLLARAATVSRIG
jgi:hypothetical protein